MYDRDALLGGPFQHRFTDLFGPIATAKIGWCAVQADQTAQDLNDATGTNAARHINGQALPGVLIHHGQTLQGLPVGTGVKDEVIAPHAISPDGQTRPWLCARHPTPLAFGRHLTCCLTPQACATLLANLDALATQKNTNAPRPKSRVLA